MNWKFIRRHNAIMAARKARITVAGPLQAKRWSAVDARRWELVTETPYEDQAIKRITLKVGNQEFIVADIEPVPPYRQSVNLLYSGFSISDREMTPAAFDVLENRVLTLAENSTKQYIGLAKDHLRTGGAMSDYDVDKRRNYDGLSNWCWVLWIDDYAWDSYATEAEAWAAAEQHHAGLKGATR